MTTGPLVEMMINGAMPGDTIDLPAHGGSLEVAARVRSVTPLSKLLLVHDGEVIQRMPLVGGESGTDFEWKTSAPISSSGWLQLRVEGDPEDRRHLDARFAQAFTNPTWVIVDGKPIRDRGAAQYSIKWVETVREMADAWPDWRSEKEKEHVFQQFNEAEAIDRKLANEAMSDTDDDH